MTSTCTGPSSSEAPSCATPADLTTDRWPLGRLWYDAAVRDPRFQDSISNILGKVFRVMVREHNRDQKPHGVSAVQGQILTTLWAEGPMTIGALQAAQALGSSTLTGALDRMEKAKQLKRTPVAGDRRVYLIEPAKWTPARKRAVLDTAVATDARLFKELTTTERRELARLLTKALASATAAASADDDD
jgi:DNA-binding MarR family transcriptional regulator